MESILQGLQSSCLLCRPKNTLQFVSRFVCEEKLSFHFPTSSLNPPPAVINQIIEEYHAIHLLPFLVTQFEEFRNTACVIFCAEQMHGHFFRDHHQFVITGGGNHETGRVNLASGSNDSTLGNNNLKKGDVSSNSNSNNNNNNSYREYLDGSTLIDIIQAMDLPSYGLQNNFIDDLVIEKLEVLKKVDFSLFISGLRLPLVSYQAFLWVKDEVYLFLKASEASILCVPVKDEVSIDIAKLKAYLAAKKQPQANKLAISALSSNNSSSSPSFQTMRSETHNYHLFPYFADDVKHWTRTLTIVVEEERSTQMVAMEQLLDKFLRKLFTQTNL